MGAFVQDLHYSLRMLCKAPGFAIVAVLALAFGIGVNSAIFTLLNAVALRPLPVQDSHRVVTVHQVMRGLKDRNVHGSRSYFSYPEYATYRDQSHVFSGLAAHALAPLTLGGPGARAVQGHLVSCNYFPVMTGSLALGRGFLGEECASPGAGAVVVLSYDFWQGQFSGDAAILGKRMVLNRNAFTIVGVGPRGFSGASLMAADVWAPLSVQEQWIPGRSFLADANLSWLELAGRLKPEATISAAHADLAVIAARMDQQHPGRTTTLLVAPATLMNIPEARGPALTVGAVILAAVSLVLVIACANLANLLLARSTVRQREFAVRLAIGASRGRLIGQLLTESLLLAVAGAALGLLTASWTLRSLFPLLVTKLPQEVQALSLNLSPDIRILLYSLVLACITAVGFGLIPALQSSRVDLNNALKEGGATAGRSRGRLRAVLVTAQIAVCLVLLIAAGLLTRGLQSAQSIDPGFRTKDIATASFDLEPQGYDRQRAGVFHRQLVARLAALPGVERVALVDPVPLSGGRHGNMVSLQDGSSNLQVSNAHVSSNYFELLGIPILRGRSFEERDAHVVIVSESTARRFWPGEDPIGKQLRYGDNKIYSEVVGVVKDIHSTGLAGEDGSFVYMPLDAGSRLGLKILVHSKTEFAAVAKAIKGEAQALDSNLLVKTARLEDNLELWQLPSRILSTLALVLGLVGLLLASMGIYGVMAYSVAQRTKEIGIRIAVGAQRRDVLWLVLTQAMRPVFVGIALGLAGCAAVSGVLSSLLFGVNPLDPVVFSGVSLFLAAIALLAGFMPAQRAARVDPIAALHHQ